MQLSVGRHPYVRLLGSHPVLARFWAGSVLSAVGDSLSWTTLVWYAVERGGNGAAVAILLLAQAVPGMISAPWFGRWLDRGSLRGILLLDNGARATLTALLPLLDALVGLPLWGLFTIVAVLGVLSPATRVGTGIATTRLVRGEDRPAANAIFAAADPIAIVVGPALGGLLVARFGFGIALWVDAATFLAMAWAAASLPGRPAPAIRNEPVEARSAGAARWLFQPLPFIATALSGLFFFAYGPSEAALPFFIKDQLRAGPETFGFAWSALGVGAILGGMAAVPLARVRRTGRLLAAGMFAWGILSIGVGHASSGTALMALYFLGGVVWGPYLPLRATLMQRCVPESRLGSVLGIQSAVLAPALPLGAALGGWLLQRTQPSNILSGVGWACLVGASIAFCVPALHHPDPSDTPEAPPVRPEDAVTM